jgi:hypothetical protein
MAREMMTSVVVSGFDVGKKLRGEGDLVDVEEGSGECRRIAEHVKGEKRLL